MHHAKAPAIQSSWIAIAAMRIARVTSKSEASNLSNCYEEKRETFRRLSFFVGPGSLAQIMASSAVAQVPVHPPR